MRKIYKIVVNDEDFTGMDAISLVEDAAVQRNFLKFNAEKQMVFQKIDDEKHIITGVVALADTPIYRYDERIGEYWVVFDRDTIEKMVEKYSKMGLFNKVNLQHNDNTFQDGIYMIESYIVNTERGIAPVEFSDVPEGSWIVSYKVESVELWNAIKTSGKLNGFSLQGLFQLEEHFNFHKYNEIKEQIKELMSFSKLTLRNLILRFQDVVSDKGILTVDGELEVGSAVFVGEVQAEDGEYKLDDVILVVADGKVAEIKPLEEVKVEEPVEEPVLEVVEEEELPAEEPVEEEKDAKIAELEAIIAEKDARIAELEALVAKQEEEMKMSVEKLADERKKQEVKPAKKSIYAGLNR